MRETLMKRTLLVMCVAAWLFVAAPQASAQRRGNTYTNPALAGDFADPSVIRVGRDYWGTATSSDWAPEFPILHSRDLVNWRVVGAVFQRRPEWSDGNYWAPEIAEHRGRYFIYYTARKKGTGPLCVAVATAARPQGPYRDHGPLICQEVGSIDGMALSDERGDRYLFWKEDGNSRNLPTIIWAQRLSPDGLRLAGDPQEMLRNDPRHEPLYGSIEGPFVVRRGGYYYLFFSGNFCCDRNCNYILEVARARAIMGPYERNPKNPILAGNETWKCPGHGSLVTDERGRDFYFYHAYSTRDTVYVGRQAMLDEVRWGSDGWPTINEGRGPSVRAASPYAARETNAEYNFFDDFRARSLVPGWQWPQGNEPLMRIERGRGGWLALSPAAAAGGGGPSGGAGADLTNFVAAVVAKGTTTGNYVATTVVDTRTMPAGVLAGLSAYGDADNALGLSVGNAGKMVMWQREKKDQSPPQQTVVMLDAPRAGRVHLRMAATDGRRFRFAVSRDGRNWTDVGGEIDGDYLPRWDRGIRVALVVGGTGAATGHFDSLRIAASR
jgi:beta-xylosidase